MKRNQIHGDIQAEKRARHYVCAHSGMISFVDILSLEILCDIIYECERKIIKHLYKRSGVD